MNFLIRDRLGLKIAIADVDEVQLTAVGEELAELVGKQNVLIVPTDVSNLEQVVKLKEKVYDNWGEVKRFFFFFGKNYRSTCAVLGCCIDEQCWDWIERYFLGRNGELAQGL